MTPEEMKARSRRFLEEGWNKNNPAVYDEVCAPNFVYRHVSYPQFKDLAGLKEFTAAVHASYPDNHITIHDQMAAEGNRVVNRYTWEGTSKGTAILTGQSPTGKHGAATHISIDRYEGDKIAEVWIEQDTLGMMKQFGYVLKKEGE